MNGMKRWIATASVLAIGLSVNASAQQYGDWGPPTWAEALNGSSSQLNTPFNDGCPILNPYDGSLYIASNRPGGQGGLDIWIAPKSGDGWGTPVNAGPKINTAADEFCPTPARGNRFFFVRRSSATDTDIFVVKHLPSGFQDAQRLPKGEGQINSDREEWSPSWFQAADGREFLYFSSTRETGGPAQDVYYSVDFGPANLAQGGVNSSASDARPNVSRNGLEIVWDSNRTGTLGGPDIFTAHRSSVDEPWGSAIHLENGINSAANETRASLSWDGTTLMFGSTRTGAPAEGSADVYVSRRTKVTGQ
ncbi:PD40 domain-containing protein [Sphingomonas astaxanthinifaciens]|nr:PD40 domain-containing protein [Sphingomonas astaxanthinifaciens]